VGSKNFFLPFRLQAISLSSSTGQEKLIPLLRLLAEILDRNCTVIKNRTNFNTLFDDLFDDEEVTVSGYV
jgi:hypothetical protein